MLCLHPLKDRDEKVKEKRKKQKKMCHLGRSRPRILSAYFSNCCFSNFIFQLGKITHWFYHFLNLLHNKSIPSKKLMVSQKPPKIQRITAYSQRWQGLLKLILFMVMQCDDILTHLLQLLDCSYQCCAHSSPVSVEYFPPPLLQINFTWLQFLCSFIPGCGPNNRY